jgi:hypothetical protein
MRNGSNPNIDDDTRARARKFVESANAPKSSVTASSPTKKTPIVTKKMLADSGYDNLRDYLNAQRGLTRRKEFDPTAGEARDRAAQEAADAIDPGAVPQYEVSETKRQKRPKNLTDLLGITTPYKSGGSVSSRADGIAQRGKTKCRFV